MIDDLKLTFIAESVGISTASLHSILTENLRKDGCHEQSDVQNADCIDALACLLHQFDENSEICNFWLLIPGFITSKSAKYGLEMCSFSASKKKVSYGFICSQSFGDCIWDAEGVVLVNYLEHGSTITAA